MPTPAETPAKLRTIVEAIEDIEAQIAGLNRGKRDVYVLAKKSNIHVPALKRVVRGRAKDPKLRADEEDAYQRYMSALDQVEPDIEDSLTRTRVHAREETSAPKQRPNGVTNFGQLPPHPLCRKPEVCLGFSHLKLCEECRGKGGTAPTSHDSAKRGT